MHGNNGPSSLNQLEDVFRLVEERGGWQMTGEQGQVVQPAIPDSSDKPIDLSQGGVMNREGQRLFHGWTIREWVEFLHRQPNATLPNGVGKALVDYYEHTIDRVTGHR